MDDTVTVFEEAVDMQATDRRYEQDKTLFVQFYERAVLSPFESAQAGRPVHVAMDYIKIMVPGNKLSNVDTIASPEYQRRFPRQWEAYKSGKAQTVVGTLLSSWQELSITTAADLNAMGIQTVEQLAGISDTIASKLPGAATLRDKAEAYLEAAKDAAIATRLAEQTEQQAAVIADLQEQLAELRAQVAKK